MGNLLSGLERVKKETKPTSLKHRKHDKAFRECIVYSVSQVSPFPVSPIVFGLIKYILLNCIFLLGLLLYSDKMRLCRQECLFHWDFRDEIWKNDFISREKIISALLVVALALRYSRERNDVIREPKFDETQSPREPAEDREVA